MFEVKFGNETISYPSKVKCQVGGFIKARTFNRHLKFRNSFLINVVTKSQKTEV